MSLKVTFFSKEFYGSFDGLASFKQNKLAYKYLKGVLSAEARRSKID